MNKRAQKIVLYGFKVRESSALEITLHNHPEIASIVSRPSDADIAVVDLDGAEHQSVWKQTKSEFSGPVIAVSVKDRDYAHPDLFIAKPYHTNKLIEAINQLSTTQRQETQTGHPEEVQETQSEDQTDIQSSRPDTLEMEAIVPDGLPLINNPQLNSNRKGPFTVHQTSGKEKASSFSELRPQNKDSIDIPPFQPRENTETISDVVDSKPQYKVEQVQPPQHNEDQSDTSCATCEIPVTEAFDDIDTLISRHHADEIRGSDLGEVISFPEKINSTIVVDTDSLDDIPVLNKNNLVDKPILNTEFQQPMDDWFYDPTQTLQGVIQSARSQAYEKNKPLEISGLGEPTIIYPQGNSVLTTLTRSHLELLVAMPTCFDQIDIYWPDENWVESIVSASSERSKSIDDFLWEITLLSANGKIPIGTSLHVPVQLNIHEDFKLPHYMGKKQMIDLWTNESVSLAESTTRLELSRNEIFSFYSALVAMGSVVQDIPQKKSLFNRLFHRTA